MHEGSAASGEKFRDRLGIVGTDGKRNWIFPRKPSGRFTRARTILSVFLLLVLFGMPLITVNGHPLMLLNVLERKFIIFGVVFGPHDFYLLGLTLLTTIVFIILFTVVFGRLFCGWICPQTVFMEMVFRRIDYWIEGDHRQQRRLNASPWTGEKILRKGTKYLLSFAVAFLIGNTFMAYVVGVEEVARVVTRPPSEHMPAFLGVTGFSVLFYWIFTWFREQACILVCPYGRLQGVLLDRSSIVIAYDHVRGEPRGKLRRDAPRMEGDCVDCHLCVEVCPTGIDIRDGTQLECVNCTACIDACDAVMDKVRKPRGLIRYDSAEGIVNNVRRLWTPRVIGYTVVLLVLTSVLGYLLSSRKDLDITLLRTPGMFFQEQPDGRVSNIYDLKILNKTFSDMPIELHARRPAGDITIMGGNPTVGPQQLLEAKVLVTIDRKEITAMSTPMAIGVTSAGREIQEITTSFLGPVKTP
jgi:cytochrome c oxidase accessory protein FixG